MAIAMTVLVVFLLMTLVGRYKAVEAELLINEVDTTAWARLSVVWAECLDDLKNSLRSAEDVAAIILARRAFVEKLLEQEEQREKEDEH